jgi:hypothetical protein
LNLNDILYIQPLDRFGATAAYRGVFLVNADIHLVIPAARAFCALRLGNNDLGLGE